MTKANNFLNGKKPNHALPECPQGFRYSVYRIINLCNS